MQCRFKYSYKLLLWRYYSGLTDVRQSFVSETCRWLLVLELSKQTSGHFNDPLKLLGTYLNRQMESFNTGFCNPFSVITVTIDQEYKTVCILKVVSPRKGLIYNKKRVKQAISLQLSYIQTRARFKYLPRSKYHLYDNIL